MSLPKSSKTPAIGTAIDVWSTGMIASIRIHKRNTSSLLSLHRHRHLRSPLQPLSSCRQYHCPRSAFNPKIEFQSLYWTPISDHAKSFIRRLAALDPFHPPSVQEVFPSPWLTTITVTPFPSRQFLPHSQTKLESQNTVAQRLDCHQGWQQLQLLFCFCEWGMVRSRSKSSRLVLLNLRIKNHHFLGQT